MVTRSKLYCLLLGAAALLGTVAGTANGKAAPGCSNLKLLSTIKLTPGGGSAGHVRYTLSVKNTGSKSCRLGNHPKLQLFGATGNKLPTHVTTSGSSKVITLAAGHTAKSTLTFLDVTSGGDHSPGPCQPVATRASVTFTAPASGADSATLKPSTRACGRGAIGETPLA